MNSLFNKFFNKIGWCAKYDESIWWIFAGQTIAFNTRRLYIISLNKKMKWLKFLLTSLLKAKKSMYLLLSKGPCYLFENFNWNFRINFQIVTNSICTNWICTNWACSQLWTLKISYLINLSKKLQKFSRNLWNCFLTKISSLTP